MDVFYLLALLVLIFFTLPIIALSRIFFLSRRVKDLEEKIHQLMPAPRKKEPLKEVLLPEAPPRAPEHKKLLLTNKVKESVEQQIGSRLFVWLAGISLALAAVFLVKYSIEKQLLSPMIRLASACIFSIVLIGIAELIRARLHLTYHIRLSQSLFGAGVIALYGVLFAAANIYHLISPIVAFLGMIIVTALTVLSSLRHGIPMAVLGLTGGFLTPLLIQTKHPSAFGLFTFLYLLFLGTILLVRKISCWWLVPAAYLAAIAWKIIWTVFYFDKTQAIWGSLFLVLISFTLFFHFRTTQTTPSNRRLLNSFSWAGICVAILLLGIDIIKVDFDLLYWGLFILIAIASLVFASMDEDRYAYLPIPVLLLSFFLFYYHPLIGMTPYHLLTALTVIFVALPYVLMRKRHRPETMAMTASLGAIGYFLLAYVKFSHFEFVHVSLFWPGLSLLLGILSILAFKDIQVRFKQHRHLEWLLAIASITASAFVAIALCLYFENKFLITALAAEGLAIAWISTRYTAIRILPYLSTLLLIASLILLFPQIFAYTDYAIKSFSEDRSYTFNKTFYFLNNPLFYGCVPALLIGTSCIFLKNNTKAKIVHFLEWITLPLFSIGVYLFFRKMMSVNVESQILNAATFFERAITLNLILAVTFLGMKYGNVYNRVAYRWSALFLLAIAILRLAYIEFYALNPIRVDDFVGNWPILNYLLIMYGIPIGWLWLIERETSSQRLKYGLNILQFILFFAFISLNIRQLYHGGYMATVKTSELELYTYSVVWGIMGIGLLILAILTRSLLYRYASLGFIAITIVKVFIFDIENLQGLYRALSFLVLGIVLIGISYVYSRYVFQKPDELTKRSS